MTNTSTTPGSPTTESGPDPDAKGTSVGIGPLRSLGKIGRPQNRDLFARLACLTVFLVIFGPVYGLWLGGSFLNVDGLMFNVYQNVPVMIIAVGLVFCLSAGQFDLSVASVATLVVFLTIGLRVRQGLPFWLVLVIALGTGLLCGLVNGVLVVKVKVNAFIATLATGGVYEGISVVYGGGEQITQTPDGPRLPRWFSGIDSYSSFQVAAPTVVVVVVALVVGWCVVVVVREQWPADKRGPRFWTITGIATATAVCLAVLCRRVFQVMPWEVVFLIVLITVAWVTMRYTTFGRSLVAIGGNPTAARLSGVPVGRHTIWGFVLTGLFSSMAGVVLAANQGTAVPGLGSGYLLPAYAAVFLSTVIISDGRFHVWGTVIGALSVVLIAQGLIIGGLPFTWNDLINGLVLGTAVAVATLLRGKDVSGTH